ncbi:MAG: DUF58 domain-containing protein [Ktedonobacteraceae bacterium]|nr:DUF58 domain-containing protein [Ktedonobacteraceae bacterium]
MMFSRGRTGQRRAAFSMQGDYIYRRWYYLGVLALIGSIVLHVPLLAVCGLLLVLVLATIDLWAHFCLHSLSYQHRLSEQRVAFGEMVTFSMMVENSKVLPLSWLEVSDVVPRALEVEGRAVRSSRSSDSATLEMLYSPRWYERITRRYNVRCAARGVHAFGPTTLCSGDLFGFVRREASLGNAQYLLVYPLVVPLSSFSIPSRHPFGELRAPRRLLEDPARVVGVRDYAYGDSMRRVHWKASARMMQLQSKVFEASTTYNMVLFLNIVSSLDVYYGVHPELHELAICAAASVSSWAIEQGYAVGLYANTILYMPDEVKQDEPELENGERNLAAEVSAQLERRRVHIPPASSGEQLARIMDVLARIQTYFGTAIEEVILAERSRLPAGATVVLITGSLTDMLIDTLVRLRQGGHAVTVLFIGDSPPPLRLAGITIYHLGGEAAWERLVAQFGNPGQAGDQGVQEGVGFSL